jgi:hypothetical protein
VTEIPDTVRVGPFKRVFFAVIGALMLWSAPHWASDGLALRRAGAPGVGGYVTVVAALVLTGSVFLYLGVSGRLPVWASGPVVPWKRR